MRKIPSKSTSTSSWPVSPHAGPDSNSAGKDSVNSSRISNSIIFSHRPGQPMLSLGDHLGEFTRELKPDDHIVEFAAAGPKNYRYKTYKGKVECKVRGFTLNTRGQAQLNYELLKQNVLDEVTQPKEDPREAQSIIRTRSNTTPAPKPS